VANFLHRNEERLSRQRQLESNPQTIVHFCSAGRKLTVGHRAVLQGKVGEIISRDFIVADRRTCKPDQVTAEEFSKAPDVANSLEKILFRLASWRVDPENIQVVTLERR
jgi:hypothetical protein